MNKVGEIEDGSSLKRSKCVTDFDRSANNASCSSGTFDKLPVELVDHILEYVLHNDRESGISARLVCQQWSSIIGSKTCFRGTLNDHTIKSFAGLDESIPWKFLMLSRLENTRIRKGPTLRTGTTGIVPYPPELFCRTINHLIIGGDVGAFLNKNCGEDLPYSLSTGFAEDHLLLKNVKQSMSGLDLVNILPQVRNVQTLSISSTGFLSTSIQMLKKIDFQNFSTLTTLDICIGKKTSASKMSWFFRNASFPVLSSLYVRAYFSCMNFCVYVAWVLFLAKHRQFLKRLSFSQSQVFYIVTDDESQSSLLVDHYPKLRENLMQVKLEYLRMDCIVFGHDIGEQWKELEREFIKNQVQLKSLELQITLRATHNTLDHFIPACEDTLERLEISTNHFRPNVFDCASISRYKKLKHCHLYLRNPLLFNQDRLQLHFAEIRNVSQLPCSIVSLHLGNILSISEIQLLRLTMVNLEKVSYGSCGEIPNIRPAEFLHQLVEHFRFPKLNEYRIYQYPCRLVMEILNKQDGMCCYIEDSDTLVVLVDKDEFDETKMATDVSYVMLNHCRFYEAVRNTAFEPTKVLIPIPDRIDIIFQGPWHDGGHRHRVAECLRVQILSSTSMKVIILDKFATVGIPDFDEGCQRNWSIVALSKQLIAEDRINGLPHLNTRQLDLVINNGSKFALLNLQAFKMFESLLATSMIRQSLGYHLTSDGNLLFGIQPSGDVFVLTKSFKTVKHVRKPYFIKLQQHTGWYERISRRLWNVFGIFSKSNTHVSPEINEQTNKTQESWVSGISPQYKSIFPYLTAVPDGFAIFCAFGPQDCFIFLSSYETVLRERSIANIKGDEVAGRWHRIIMDKNFVCKWLEDKGVPWFEARLCYTSDSNNNLAIGGSMLYAAFVDLQLELAYGIVKRSADRFTLSWETIKYQLDWVLGEQGIPINLGSRYVARLSSDCTKIAIVVNTHLGMYIHVEHLPSYPEDPVKLERQIIAVCNHGDYDGTTFYKRECWISDVQWLVEDAYFACITLCGCLSIFHVSGEPMIIKVRQPGAEPDEDKSARFFFPVFHQQQISTTNKSTGNLPYPTLKWMDSEKILTCSSGMKIELFSIKRVLDFTNELSGSKLAVFGESTLSQPVAHCDESWTLLVVPTTPKSKDILDSDKESVMNNNKAVVDIMPDLNENNEENNDNNSVR